MGCQRARDNRRSAFEQPLLRATSQYSRLSGVGAGTYREGAGPRAVRTAHEPSRTPADVPRCAEVCTSCCRGLSARSFLMCGPDRTRCQTPRHPDILLCVMVKLMVRHVLDVPRTSLTGSRDLQMACSTRLGMDLVWMSSH